MADAPKSKEGEPGAADGKPKPPGMEWDGKMVTDPAELPPALRPLLEDANHNGIPDLYEQGVTHPIIVNGKLYRSVEEVPEPFRAEVEKALAARQGVVTPAPSVEISRTFTINGQSYASLDEVPAEERDLIRQAMSKMIGEKPKTPQPEGAQSHDLEFPWALPENQPTGADRARSSVLPWVILAAAAGAGLTYLLAR